MSVTPDEHNLTIYVGADFYQTFTFYDANDAQMDISAWVPEAQIRSTYLEEDALASFTVSTDEDTSAITISMTASGTSELSLNTEVDLSDNTTSSTAVWDLVITTASGSGYREPYVKGVVEIVGMATRS